jgi:hypothetical protein
MKPHAHIHLPPLSANQALRLVAMLEHAISAIWRAHGDAMAEELNLLGVPTPPPPDPGSGGTTPDADLDAELHAADIPF